MAEKPTRLRERSEMRDTILELAKRLRERAGQYDEYDWHSAIELETADVLEFLAHGGKLRYKVIDLRDGNEAGTDCGNENWYIVTPLGLVAWWSEDQGWEVDPHQEYYRVILEELP